MLGSNLHNQLLAAYQPKPTVDDKYGVHFEYSDLYTRLEKVKAERDGKGTQLRREKARISSLIEEPKINDYNVEDIPYRVVQRVLSRPKTRKVRVSSVSKRNNPKVANYRHKKP